MARKSPYTKLVELVSAGYHISLEESAGKHYCVAIQLYENSQSHTSSELTLSGAINETYKKIKELYRF